MKLLAVEDLDIWLTWRLPGGMTSNRQIACGVSFELESGQVLGILGESGSGKTLLAYSLTGLLGKGVIVRRGVMYFNGEKMDLARSSSRLGNLRGQGIFLLPQSPAGAFHPYRSVVNQLMEISRNIDTEALLERVGIPKSCKSKAPFCFSGGMQRRILLAMAMAIRPLLLIADEPTEGLDPVTKWEVLSILGHLIKSSNTAMIFITHDLESLAALESLVGVDRVRVALFHRGVMDIRKSVIELIIKKYGDDVYPVVTRTQKEQRKLLEINSLEKSYAKTSKVLDGISFSLEEGKNGGFIGRSGVGKTTLLKCIAGIEPFNKGVLMWEGKEFNPFPYRFQGEVQLLWQDPYVSLNPYLMSKDIIVEPLGNIKDAKDKLLEIIETVGLVEDSLYKYPWELSGGQCQRVALARSLIKRPRLLLLDEPFSGLYPPDRRKLTHVLKKFCSEKGITLLVASHDLTVVETLTNQVWVLDKGMIVEQGEPQKVFINPAHSETVALVEASKRFSNLLNR